MSENSRRDEVVQMNEAKWREMGLDIGGPPPASPRTPAHIRVVRIAIKAGRPVPVLPRSREAAAQRVLEAAARRMLNERRYG